jgi:tRNA threonylcarbamoyladenosine biosynthesis protein TsaB
MRLLAVETSTPTGAVALLEDGRVVAESRLSVEGTHGGRLLATIDGLLGAAGWTVRGLDGLAIAVGPGSFTGLRIGISTVKGLAFATGTPLVAVPTLPALAWSLPFAAYPLCPVLDARKGEVYAGLFGTARGRLERLGPDRAVGPRALAEELAGEPGPAGRVIFLGDGVAIYGEVFTDILGEAACLAPPGFRLPSAVSVGALGMEALARGEVVDPAALTPIYLRPSEAELARERRQHAGHPH